MQTSELTLRQNKCNNARHCEQNHCEQNTVNDIISYQDMNLLKNYFKPMKYEHTRFWMSVEKYLLWYFYVYSVVMDAPYIYTGTRDVCRMSQRSQDGGHNSAIKALRLLVYVLMWHACQMWWSFSHVDITTIWLFDFLTDVTIYILLFYYKLPTIL